MLKLMGREGCCAYDETFFILPGGGRGGDMVCAEDYEKPKYAIIGAQGSCFFYLSMIRFFIGTINAKDC